jgi:Cd2+/Zn2+-exporting ATPase
MDCAACAARIQGALERLPGVSEVSVSVMTERLTLSLDDTSTPPETVERVVEGLGYTVARRAGGGRRVPPDMVDDHSGHGHGREHGDAAWYATARGRLVVLTGSLLAAAWVLTMVVPGSYGP